MLPSPFDDPERLTSDQNDLINRLIEEYEDLAESEPRPEVGNLLSSCPDELRPQLLYEFCGVDFHQLVQQLKLRFPNDHDVVTTALRDRAMYLAHSWSQSADEPNLRLHSTVDAEPEINGYRIERMIGEGAMGQVWLAEQLLGVRREVAIKVIKHGMNSREILARFEQEKQTLAKLGPDGIASVYDSGLTKDGRPYFAMRFVDGTALDQHCVNHDLSVKARLELFLSACRVVRHAHQNAFIHRDLKTSHLLVTDHDGQTSVVIIDFGLAKDISKRSSYVETQHGQLLGTYHYMSPEQATPGSVNIDTRSDIYSLGCVLYEILTGQPPLEPDYIDKHGLPKTIDRILGTPPPAPSSISTIPLDADIDCIVLKSLEKEPDRRYPTVDEFAKDIKRYLNREPIEARPASRFYKTRRFAQRNPVLVTAGILAFAALAMGLIVALHSSARSARAEKIAKEQKANADRLRVAAEQAARKSQWQTYAAKIQRAGTEWEHGDGFQANEILSTTKPEFRDWEYHFLKNALTAHDLSVAHIHESMIADMAISPDGKFLYTIGGDPWIGVWRRNDSKSPFVFSRKIPYQAAFGARIHATSNGKYLVCAGHTNVYRINLATDKQELFVALQERIRDISVHPTCERLVVAAGRRVLAFDLESKQAFVDELYQLSFVPWCLSYSKSGHYLVVGGERLALWELNDGRPTSIQPVRLTSQFLKGTVVSVAISPDEQRIATGDSNGFLAIRSAEDLALESEANGHKGWIESVRFNADGAKIVSTSRDQTVKTWDTVVGTIDSSMKGHSRRVSRGLFIGEGELVSSGWDEDLRFWKSRPRSFVEKLGNHTRVVMCATISPNQKYLASGGWNKTVEIRSLENEAPHQELPHDESISYLAFSPNSSLLAVANGPAIHIWDFSTETITKVLRGHGHNVTSLCFNSDGTRLASSSADKTVMTWDCDDWSEAHHPLEHPAAVRHVCFDIHDKSVLTACADANVRKWDLLTGKQIVLHGHKAQAEHIAMSPNGETFASCALDGTIILWDRRSLKQLRTLTLPVKVIRSIAFNHSGCRLLSSGTDGTVRVWSVESGEQVLALNASVDSITHVEFARNGKSFVSSGNDGKVMLWKTERKGQ